MGVDDDPRSPVDGWFGPRAPLICIMLSVQEKV